jgi:cell division protein DivIC
LSAQDGLPPAKRTQKSRRRACAARIEISFTPARAGPLIAFATMNSRRLIITLYIVLFAGLGVGTGAFLRDALGEYNHLKRAEAESQRRLADAQALLAKQEKILERLRTDPAFVEKVIRKNLGYTKPGDFIYRFEN